SQIADISRIRCETPLKHAEIEARMVPLQVHDKADGVLDLREGYPGSEAGHLTSTHFAFKWGPSGPIPTATDQQNVLNDLEAAWKGEVVDRNMAQPAGTTGFFMNVYLGNSGGVAPTITWDGAYATLDPDGYPIIVMHPKGLTMERGSILAHEF